MAKQQTTGVPVTTRALMQRIGRSLAADNKWLRIKKCRSARWKNDLGEYYIIDLYHNFIKSRHVDIEKLGREMEVLQPWESMVGE